MRLSHSNVTNLPAAPLNQFDHSSERVYHYLCQTKPVQLQVIAPVLEGYSLCNTCELLFNEADLDSGSVERGGDEYPQHWEVQEAALGSHMAAV